MIKTKMMISPFDIQIGKFYMVDCCIAICEQWEDFGKPVDIETEYGVVNGIVIPVINNFHNDIDVFNFPHYHYHIDHRFTRGLLLDKRSSQVISKLWAHKNGIAYRVDYDNKSQEKSTPIIIRKKMKMKRLHIGFPENKDGVWDDYIGKKKLKNMVCPHKGYRLTETDIDTNGNYVCPIHGLKFCSKTMICNGQGTYVMSNGFQTIKQVILNNTK